MHIADDDWLQPLKAAIKSISYDHISPTTQWRWITRGLSGEGGQRIRLRVWYVGRKPYTTRAAIMQFLEAVTAARLARVDRKQALSLDVNDSELRSAGLLGRSEGGAR